MAKAKQKNKKETISAEAELWGLNQRQFDFCNEFVKTNDQKQAAIKAGYSIDNASQQASRMLTYANVQKYIAELRKDIRVNTIASAEQVLDRITKIAFGEVKETETLFIDDKEVTKEKAPRTSDMLKALELLGKHHSLFTDKVNMTASVDSTNRIVDITDLSDEEIERKLSQLGVNDE